MPTAPTVIQETKYWVNKNEKKIQALQFSIPEQYITINLLSDQHNKIQKFPVPLWFIYYLVQ